MKSKKKYSRPQLISLGTVSQITAADTPGMPNDNGNPPFQHALPTS